MKPLFGQMSDKRFLLALRLILVGFTASAIAFLTLGLLFDGPEYADYLERAAFRVNFAGTLLETIALIGNPTDIGGGDTYQRFRDTPSIENDGIVAFRADTSTTEAVFRCAPSSSR